MSEASNISTMNTEFEEFLFASVGEQKNGMSVSLFSALSRLDLDPWREAKRLSDLPKDRAIQALRGSIDRLVDLQWTKIDALGIAARLIRLLPNHGGLALRQHKSDESTFQQGGQIMTTSLFGTIAAAPTLVWAAIGAVVIIVLYTI